MEGWAEWFGIYPVGCWESLKVCDQGNDMVNAGYKEDSSGGSVWTGTGKSEGLEHELGMDVKN